jgi:hypothetical protein
MSIDDSTPSTIKDLAEQASKLHDQIKVLNDVNKLAYKAADYYFYLFTERFEEARLDASFSMFTAFLFDHQIAVREQSESLFKALKELA